jgi:nicotinamidase-related amidase
MEAVMNVQLLIIDPQNDFVLPTGALSVAGADADMDRLASMIRRIGHKFDEIHVTLDSHHKLDIAHPLYWKDQTGRHPDPFTIIKPQDMCDGVWTTTVPGFFRRTLDYLQALKASYRYDHCVWPEHCLIGTSGHNVYKPLLDALMAWEDDQIGVVDYVTKGSNIFTEHFSVIQAEVPDPVDPTTQVNMVLMDYLENCDVLAVAGEAGSHCVANTLFDIKNNFKDPDSIKKIVLLTDAVSPVTGMIDFTPLQDRMIQEMTALGMQLSTTVDFLA